MNFSRRANLFEFDRFALRFASRFCFADGDDDGDGKGGGDGGGDEGDDKGGAGKDGKDGGDGGGDDGGGAGDGDDKDGGKGDDGKKDGRPDNVPEQFWDAEKKSVRTDALLKAFTDTKADRDRYANAAKGTGEIPKEVDGYFDGDKIVNEGKFVLPEDGLGKVKSVYPEGVPLDDPMLRGMAESAHRNGVSQKAFLGMLTDFFMQADGALDDDLDVDAELEKMGKGGKETVEAFQNFVNGLHESGVFSAKDVENTIAFARNASEMQTMVKWQAMAEGRSTVVPIDDAAEISGVTMSKEDYYAEMGKFMDGEFDENSARFKKVKEAGIALFGEGTSGSSQKSLGMPRNQGGVRK